MVFRVIGQPKVRYVATGRVMKDGSIELVLIQKDRPRHLRCIRADRLVVANDEVSVKA